MIPRIRQTVLFDFGFFIFAGLVILIGTIWVVTRDGGEHGCQPTPHIRSFIVQPDYVCDSSSCVATVEYEISGPVSTDATIRLVLKKSLWEQIVSEGETSYSGSITASQLSQGEGVYIVKLVLNDISQQHPVTFFEEEWPIIHLASVTAEYPKQYLLTDEFSLGAPDTSATYTFCDKNVFLKGIQYSSPGTEDDDVAIFVDGIGITLSLHETYEFPGNGLLISDAINITSRQARTNTPYVQGAVYNWQLTLYLACAEE